MPGTLRSPTVKREPRLRGARQQFADRLIIVWWAGLVTGHAKRCEKIPTDSFAVIVVQEGQSGSDDIKRPDV